ncbi:MAG TPA: hypothetical protein VFY09_00785 [Flavobacteriaceae bacterium]|nr:hypothetical protein [Flavobacteriaceae bacterium]HEX5742416.1 hypothetical protein [Flavobacteriaceae bacterium]
MKNYFFILILSFSALVSWAQKDTSKVKLIDDAKKINANSFPIKAVNADKKIIPTNKLEIDHTPNISKEIITNTVQKKEAEPLKQFVLAVPKREKDIVVKKYWMGNDVTDKKIISTVSLGNVNTKSKQIRIEFRDFGLIDGDRIQIYLNEKIIKQNVVLNGNFFFINLNLEPGFNRIDIQALNEGSVGPNTAAINVYDDLGNLIVSNQWNLTTNEIATLGVLKK